MSTENGTAKPVTLPQLKDVYDQDSLPTLRNAAHFTVLVNQEPKKEWIHEHPTVKGLMYIPIERIEWLLANIIIRYRIEVKSVQQVANSIMVSVRLHYFDPVFGEWTFHDGVGAAPLQTDKGAGAADATRLKSNAVQIGAPAAKSYAIKDAAEQIGKLFGKDLNRKDNIQYSYEKMVETRFDNALK